MKDMELDVEKYQTQFTQTQLDTTLELRQTRDNLINLKYTLEEKQIVVDQSIYEPPATQRQAQIELDKARRNYEQAVENYQVKLDKAEAEMREVSASLRKAQQEYQQMEEILEKFTIFAPKSGMVIYRRNWDGQKQGIGATVNMWDPVVAELPNLKEMISKTFVNEIDISKVRVGQETLIGVDAFPDKEYTGVVSEVANIGQQLPNTNAKVFEVVVQVNEYDSILRPAMTTKNEIITAVIDSVVFIPLECLYTNDSISFVYKSRRKQQVIPGRSNENEIIIRAGLEEDDEILLAPPEDADSWSIDFLDPEIIAQFEEKEEEKVVEEPEEDPRAKMRERWENMSEEDKKKFREKMGKERGGKNSDGGN
jgi:multidrug efflux pump subunit AcrA (membrane-fusion protein)